MMSRPDKGVGWRIIRKGRPAQSGFESRPVPT